MATFFRTGVSPRALVGLLVGVVLLCAGRTTHAQWLTQSISLKAGWNAVFLHVDASHDTLDALVGDDSANPILEIWRWNPASVAQFNESPAQPGASVEWTTWNRTNAVEASLRRLVGDSAYLVRAHSDVVAYNWSIKGRPVVPRDEWTISGLNLIGFSTPPNTPPNLHAFLAHATELRTANLEIYGYPGGELGPSNPRLLPAFLQAQIPVQRGEAFWVRSGMVFNHYFGPVKVASIGSRGVEFGDWSSSSSFRLSNLTGTQLTVTLRLLNSEPAPADQVLVAGVPPLLLRGSVLNMTNLTYGYTNLPPDSPHTWTLAPRNQPGSEVELVIGLNRGANAQPPGTLLAGILRITDSLGLSQVDLPVSATVANTAGLWVGSATIDKVGQYLVRYARADQTNYVEAPNGERRISSIATNQLVLDANGRYVVAAVDTSLAPVPRPYSGRLIIHSPTNGHAVLLQRVYYGFDPGTNVVVATGESALHPGFLGAARRISSTFLPWTTANTRWELNGRLEQAVTLSNTDRVRLSFDDQAANPFLHTYHPDHDNLNATFDGAVPQGVESYTIERAIQLIVKPPADDFSSIVTAGEALAGDYKETVTVKGLGSNSREYQVSGAFSLKRISPVPSLTIAP